jgi:hypothetical protein
MPTLIWYAIVAILSAVSLCAVLVFACGVVMGIRTLRRMTWR